LPTVAATHWGEHPIVVAPTKWETRGMKIMSIKIILFIIGIGTLLATSGCFFGRR
jgi:hypothetical protein